MRSFAHLTVLCVSFLAVAMGGSIRRKGYQTVEKLSPTASTSDSGTMIHNVELHIDDLSRIERFAQNVNDLWGATSQESNKSKRGNIIIVINIGNGGVLSGGGGTGGGSGVLSGGGGGGGGSGHDKRSLSSTNEGDDENDENYEAKLYWYR